LQSLPAPVVQPFFRFFLVISKYPLLFLWLLLASICPSEICDSNRHFPLLSWLLLLLFSVLSPLCQTNCFSFFPYPFDAFSLCQGFLVILLCFKKFLSVTISFHSLP
ncbi:MAG TPA: hypothetical protein H9687_05505, partial [Firmicutes bacterium]|nr:hypothetical protein [Bacillota bacterium]